MSELTITDSYVGGLNAAVAAATLGGHIRLNLLPGVYAAGTIGTSNRHLRGIAKATPKLTIRGKGSRNLVIVAAQTLQLSDRIRWQNVTFCNSPVSPGTRTLPLFGAGVRHALTMTGTTGGTFTLTFKGQTTAAIPWNSTGLTIAAALRLLSNVNELSGTTGADVLGSGGPLGTASALLDWQWDGAYGGLPIHNDLSANTSLLTGPAPALSIGASVPVASGAKNTNDNGITITALTTDEPWPRLRASYVNLASQAENLVVTVAPGTRDITVGGLGTDANRRTTTIASSIIAAVNADPVANKLITATNDPGTAGTGVVSCGFPYWSTRGQGGGTMTFFPGTQSVEFVGCEFVGGSGVRLDYRVKDVKIKHCKWEEANFAINWASDQFEPPTMNTRICHNFVYGGYNTDASAMRPSRFDSLWIEDNEFVGTVDPPEAELHVDTFQPINNSKMLWVKRNKFLNMHGQMFYMNNFLWWGVFIENNLITQYTPSGTASLSSRIGGAKSGYMCNNTIDVVSFNFEDGDNAVQDEATQNFRLFNNICTRFGRTAINFPVRTPHDYNIIAVYGTGITQAANETTTLPVFVLGESDIDDPDYRFLNASQPGVGDGTVAFMGYRVPKTDIKGNLRPQGGPVDMGCYVATAATP